MTLSELENMRRQCLEEVAGAEGSAAVESLRVKYVGRNGLIPALIKAMKDVPKEERPAFGKAIQARSVGTARTSPIATALTSRSTTIFRSTAFRTIRNCSDIPSV